MNIYIHTEVAARELDSKLLLAVLAAEKGHQVLVSSRDELAMGFKSGTLNPGIYHTKSLTPSVNKIKRHEEIVNNGFKITSIDEESGITAAKIDQFVKDRYSDKTIDQSSAVFTWGKSDLEELNKNYPKHKSKIFKTGSPRVDLWKPFFFNYWAKPKGMPSKPFLLISSNLVCTNNKPFYEIIKFYNEWGYFKTNPNLFEFLFHEISEDYKKLYEFIVAIRYLSENNTDYDIVVRPHPSENIEAWKTFLKGYANVYVIKEDSITAWVKYAFAIMHNGCTTSIEAKVSGKPIITYLPFEMKCAHSLPNTLGCLVKTKEELLVKANKFFNLKKNNQQKNDQIPELINEKLYVDENELAAKKIVKVWHSLNDKNLSKSNNWVKFYLLLNFLKFAKKFVKIFKILSLNKINFFKDNQKYPPLNGVDINSRVIRLKDILGIKENINCKILSERSILIKKG